MQDTQKKEYTLRISQANRTQLIVIIYEMALDYVAEAQKAEQPDEYESAIRHAGNCVEELKHSLDFQYELSATLLHTYIHIKKLLVRASLSGKKEYLTSAYEALEKLKNAFSQVAEQDDSAPLLENAQAVYAGFTYGKNDINVNLDSKSTGRGFLV